MRVFNKISVLRGGEVWLRLLKIMLFTDVGVNIVIAY